MRNFEKYFHHICMARIPHSNNFQKLLTNWLKKLSNK